MKLLKHIINWTVWSLLALYLLALIAVRLPSCQQFLGSKVAEATGRKLGTKVSIGTVNLGFLNRIILDDVRILDQQDKEMLRVTRMTVRLEILPLAEGRISVSSAQLFGAHATLYRQHAHAKPNYQFVIDSLASKDTTSHTPLNLRVNSFIMRHSSIQFDQWDTPSSPGLLDLHHLKVANISAHINLKTLTDDSLDVTVKRLGFEEQSGLTLNQLSLKLKADKSSTHLRELVLEMPSTHVEMDAADASYRWGEKGPDMSTLVYSAAIKNTYVTPSDLRFMFIPLKNLQRSINISTAFQGTGYHLDIPELRLLSEVGDLALEANGYVDGMEKQTPAWKLNITQLTLSDNIIDFLEKSISQLPPQVKELGGIQLSGNFSGEHDGSLAGTGLVRTGVGQVDADFMMTGSRQFSGRISTEGLNLHQLLGNEQLGHMAANLKLDGQLSEGKIDRIGVEGSISQLSYNDYPYSNIMLDGSYTAHTVTGNLQIDDPNISAELEGSMAQAPQDGQYTVNVKGKARGLIPQALKLTDQWGNATFAGDLQADFTARTLNDAIGTLRISHFTMTEDGQNPYHLDNLLVSTGFDGDHHFVTLVSDFAKAELKGSFEYATLSQSVTNLIASKLPTLPGLPPVSDRTHNNFAMKMQVFKTDWLQRLLGISLNITQPMTLDARLNDQNHTLYLEGALPAFHYNGAAYSDAQLYITMPADTMICEASLNKLSDSGDQLHLALNTSAADNKLRTSLVWSNGKLAEQMGGQLNCITELYRNLAGKPEAHMRIQPSHIILNDTVWNVEPSDILYSEKDLLIDHFNIHHGQQHITIDGKATQRKSDSLTIDLNEVEVAYIMNLVNFHSVEFSGKATGQVTARSLFDDFKAHANLKVGNFKFENGRMGTLHALADWNKDREQIDINAIADDGPDAMTYITGYVSPEHNTIDLKFRAQGTYIDFMHNFTHSFLSSITGHADGDLRLAGTLDNINLTGLLLVEGEAFVTALNTGYQLKRDTVNFIPDEIELHGLTLEDKYGNHGRLSGGIHHQHLTNLTFDLAVETDNLLAYDFKDFGESTFYGTVFASGDVAIKGRPGEVIIDCNVTPQKNTVFVYNASSPDAISNQEFIEWGSGQRASLPSAPLQSSPVTNIEIPTDIYINFLINCTPDATMRLLMDANTNDYITLNGDGTIRATFYNKGPFNMFGTYTVDHGTYGITIQNIIKKNFTFNRGGTIVFGGDPYNAALNLQALYTVNGVSLSDLNIGNSFASNTIRVNCLMNIGGQPNAPQVDFDLEMPTVNADEQQMVRSVINGQQEMNQQVLYLLGIGRFYNQGQNNSSVQQQDQTSLAMQSFLSGTLSTQINSLLSTVIKNDNWNFGANISTGNEGWHNAEYEGLISGRMLNNRLLLNGQFGYRDNATQANPSFIGDFDIQYLLYPNGNLALKMYNQTNDRYFTKSSLNTQGVGLIMKKDFNGLRNLFSGSRKKSRKNLPKP